MRATFSTAIVAAALLADRSNAAEISSSTLDKTLSTRDFGFGSGWSSGWGTTWGSGWNAWANPANWGSFSWGSSLASKTCYGAPSKPWIHGSSPGWWIGDGSKCGSSLPKWDGGDAHWCGNAQYAKSTYCMSGNAPGNYPPTDSTCWGVSGGSWGWPQPVWGPTPKPPTSPTPKPPTGPPAPICDDGYKQVFSNFTTTPSSGVYSGQVVGAATIDDAHYLTYGLADTVDECLATCDQTASCAFVNVYHDHLPKGDLASMPKYASGKFTCALFSACSGPAQATNYGGIQDPTYITDSSGWCRSGDCKK